MEAAADKGRKYWKLWKRYATGAKVDPYLRYKKLNRQRLSVLSGYLHRVRSGAFGEGETVTVQTVQEAIRGVALAIQLDGRDSPLHRDPKHYILSISRQVAGYQNEDPPPDQKVAVPVTVPNYLYMVGHASSNPCTKAVGELTLTLTLINTLLENTGLHQEGLEDASHPDLLMMIRNLIPFSRDTKGEFIKSYFELKAVTAAKNNK